MTTPYPHTHKKRKTNKATLTLGGKWVWLDSIKINNFCSWRDSYAYKPANQTEKISLIHTPDNVCKGLPPNNQVQLDTHKCTEAGPHAGSPGAGMAAGDGEVLSYTYLVLKSVYHAEQRCHKLYEFNYGGGFSKKENLRAVGQSSAAERCVEDQDH